MELIDEIEAAWADHRLGVVHDYDTADRDLESLGMSLSRLPSEAGVVWRLCLPRGELIEEWEPGNEGLRPPAAVAALVDAVAAGKPLVPAPPLPVAPGAVRLRELLDEQRRALLVHDPGVRVGDDPENLHQHRVAARRARAFMRATRRSLDEAWHLWLDTRLRELGSATGPARDLDVVLEHVRAEVGRLDDRDAEAGRLLLEVLERERALVRGTLLRALDGESYRALLTRLRQPPRLAEGVVDVPLRRIADKELRRLLAALERIGSRPDPQAIHALRIRLKRVRYAAELAAPEGKARRRFLDDARLLQDLLGEHQDAVVAEERLRAAAVSDASTHAAFVAGRIAERQLARRARVHEQLPAAWKRLRRSGRRLRRG